MLPSKRTFFQLYLRSEDTTDAQEVSEDVNILAEVANDILNHLEEVQGAI